MSGARWTRSQSGFVTASADVINQSPRGRGGARARARTPAAAPLDIPALHACEPARSPEGTQYRADRHRVYLARQDCIYTTRDSELETRTQYLCRGSSILRLAWARRYVGWRAVGTPQLPRRDLDLARSNLLGGQLRAPRPLPTHTTYERATNYTEHRHHHVSQSHAARGTAGGVEIESAVRALCSPRSVSESKSSAGAAR